SCQAEDGIRDRNVTGVQTCALPIFHQVGNHNVGIHQVGNHKVDNHELLSTKELSTNKPITNIQKEHQPSDDGQSTSERFEVLWKIGRASCRERVKIGRVREA